MFYVGQEVECINAFRTHEANVTELIEGAIYTIRDLEIDRGELCVRLNEIKQRSVVHSTMDKVIGYNDTPFWGKRFRPLVKKTTDISIFTEMLIPIKQKEIV